VSDHHEPFEPQLILPVGTQVVTRAAIKTAAGEVLQPRGSVGVIVDALPDEIQVYRIRFPSGGEAILARQDFAIRKHLRQATLQRLQGITNDDLYQYVVYRCIVGSKAYGLDNDESDTDRRGIYLAPPELQWSLAGAPEQLENEATQETYWELQKFLMMALKANPNVLECLYTPFIETKTPLVDELLAMRSIFLSRFIYQTYNGYVLSQFKKLEADLRTRGEPRWKHAMHLIRLLLSGITILREGFVMVRVDTYREQLLSIKRAEMPWTEVNAWRLSLHREFDKAFTETALPERPDYEKADAFLIKARRSMVEC
jgi:uncharacterized protein